MNPSLRYKVKLIFICLKKEFYCMENKLRWSYLSCPNWFYVSRYFIKAGPDRVYYRDDGKISPLD